MTVDITSLLDAGLRGPFSALPELIDGIEDPERARAFRNARFAALAAQDRPESGIRHEDVMIPRDASQQEDLLVRIYRPVEPRPAGPALVWLHGGGFTGGSVRYDDSVCEWFVDQVGVCVISVEYRLLPDHPYPAAVEDAYAAVRWTAANADRLGLDPARVAVAGLSAGATIAAGVSLLARDRAEVQLCFQLLLYGSTDHTLSLPSAREIADPRSPYRAMAANQWRAYLGAAVDDPPPYAVPHLAADLSGLPPAYVMVGEVEIARDENIAYAQRLISAGVSTELHVYPGAFHGFDVVVPDAQISRDARDDYVRALRRAFRSSAPSEPTRELL